LRPATIARAVGGCQAATHTRFLTDFHPLRWTCCGCAASALLHVRGRAGARKEVLAWRREDVDHLRVLEEPRLVLDAARHDGDVARPADLALGAEAEVHPPRDHPEHL